MGHFLCDTKDVPANGAHVLTIEGGREIALFRLGKDIYALDNACPHAGAPLGDGEIKGSTVICPLHAWEFDIRDGSCINMPGMDADSLPIEVREGKIYLKDKS
jgi:NAD(P)H-dependent nitrite reductase small subunit